MTRFNLYLVIGLLFGAILAILIAEDSGYVLLRWRGWQLETSIWLAMGLLLSLVVSLTLLWRFCRSTLLIPMRLRHWLGLRSARGAQRRTDKGLAAFFEGRWDVAESALRKVHPSETRTLLHPLYTSIAAYRKGQHDQAKALLSSAEAGGDTPKHLVLMARAECHLAMEAYDQARQTLGGLTGSEQALPRSKKLLAQVAYAQKQWVELIGLTTDLRGGHQLPEMLLDIWEREAYCALLSDESRSAKELLTLWRQVPALLKEEGSEAWAIVTRNLVSRAEWDLLQKGLIERLRDYYDTASMDAVHAFPDRQGAKLQKALRRWLDKDLDGQCHAALAYIAEQDGRTEEAGALWQQAYSLGKLPRFAMQWSRWLRQEGDEARAGVIEQEALCQLKAP